MANLFKKKSVTQLLGESKSKTLTKTLGAFDLTMLGIGAIIGTGVLVLTGLVATRDAGPAVIFSFMIAPSFVDLQHYVTQRLLLHFLFQVVYTYSYATIGEFVAHLMGWTLLSVYVVTTAAVAGGWTGYFHNLVSGLGLEIPKALLTIPSQGGIVNLPAVIVTLVITWLLSRYERK